MDWNGIHWNFKSQCISILARRIERFIERKNEIKAKWPLVNFRDVSRFNGQIISMMPVLEERALLMTRFLHCIVNVRHFEECSWDKVVRVDKDLLSRAYLEILFWENHVSKLNFRMFNVNPPNIVAWVDAAAMAAGGMLCKLKAGTIGVSQPVTADNLLLSKSEYMLPNVLAAPCGGL